MLAVWRSLAPEQRWILSGDSAGAGLVLAAAMCLRDANAPLPGGLLLLSPWADLTLSGASIDALARHEPVFRRPGLELMAGRYAGTLPRDDARVSPIHGDFHGLPPMLIQVGGHEVLLDDARMVARKAEQAGVAVELQIYPEQVHVFQATPMLEAGTAAISAIADWARSAPQ